MDKITKSLTKLSGKELDWMRNILEKLQNGDTVSLHLQKLRGRNDIYRAKKGRIRILYRLGQNDGKIYLLAVERRNEKTYKQ
jgi:mRNA-degrading endonuclease RelE of RelBE toxin-antitoxin system